MLSDFYSVYHVLSVFDYANVLYDLVGVSFSEVDWLALILLNPD